MSRYSTAAAERLPPIASFEGTATTVSRSNTPVLPPVSCIVPQPTSLLSPIHTTLSGFSSPEFTSPHSTPLTYHHQPTTSPTTPTSNGYFHYHQDATMLPYEQRRPEKRRRNAGASARFRDRRKQRERDMQEKCQFLERRVQELESMDTAKRISELERRLEEANSEKHDAKSKIRELEEEIHHLRSQLSVHDYLTPSSSSGESDTKEYYSPQSRSSRASSLSFEQQSNHQYKQQQQQQYHNQYQQQHHTRLPKPTDVQSLLS
ncbi:5457_t:CDS:2 [Ambispora leptoticha]|uniref:5457_t:CDS:1 n=1 Tax=Ambispora leptoticha TaxID=144679 RepID=A0A9N8ZYH5_9GLOM|nr:5457_t:CDS:2 [Ambispora leptoticha]